jgi:hypothetical protein
MKKCPFCAEEIQDDAIKCTHCKEWLVERNSDQSKIPETTPQQSVEVDNHRLTEQVFLDIEYSLSPLRKKLN